MSTSRQSYDFLGLEKKEEIDKLCVSFEAAWKNGGEPRIEEFLAGLEASVRRAAFSELLHTELELARKLGSELSRAEYLRRFPDLQAEVVAVWREEDERPTIDSNAGRLSRGLHIRCPHCSNGVELLADTPFEEITCATCGSNFNLAVRDESTLAASTLREVGRFELISRLGLGGFGTVWKARDTELDRVVAIKIPRKGQLSSDEIEQFYREARAVAQLKHPNIVPVHEVGKDGDTIFIVSDLVRGIPLSDWLTGHRPSAREVAELCLIVAKALHHAHETGIVHRDLKPSNILVDQTGQYHLMDFGLAKRESTEITMTTEGQIIGTPAYMSPEQAKGLNAWTDRRTDLYSLGVIMFELLTGEKPFRGNAQMQVYQRQMEDAPDPRTLNRYVPHDLSTICLKCLERDPNKRYANAQYVAEELQRFLAGEPIHARPISRVNRIARWCLRNPALTSLAALVLLGAIIGPLVALRIENQRQRLVALVAEKNNLIEAKNEQHQTSIESNNQLQHQLDIWQGKANPWELWPPKATQDSRRQILQQAFERYHSPIVSQVAEADQRAPNTAVLTHLSLAILADSAEKSWTAVKHYQLALGELKKLAEEHPESRRYQRALADCHVQLSRLLEKQDRQAAEQHLDASIVLYKRLEHISNDKMAAVERLDAQIRSAVLTGFEDSASRLQDAAQLSQLITDTWPTDPARLYQFVCFLAQRDATLLLTGDADAERP